MLKNISCNRTVLDDIFAILNMVSWYFHVNDFLSFCRVQASKMLEYQKRTSAMATATHRGPIYKSGGQLDVTWSSSVENWETTTTTYLLTKNIPLYSHCSFVLLQKKRRSLHLFSLCVLGFSRPLSCLSLDFASCLSAFQFQRFTLPSTFFPSSPFSSPTFLPLLRSSSLPSPFPL